MDDNKVLIDEQNLYDIADAIRRKNGETVKYLPDEMPPAIDALSAGASLANNLATAYNDLVFPVKANDMCIYDGNYYVANVAIETAEPFNPEKWDRSDAGKSIISLRDMIGWHALTLASGNLATVCEQLYRISTTKSTTIYMSSAATFTLSGGALTASSKGVVCRTNATTFDFMVIDSSGSLDGSLVTWRVSNLTDSTLSVGKINRYISVANSNGEYARDTISSPYTKYYAIGSNASSIVINVGNGARALIIISASNNDNNAMFFVASTNSGVPSVTPILLSTNYAVDTSVNGIITLTRSVLGTSQIMVVSMRNAANTMPTVT